MACIRGCYGVAGRYGAFGLATRMVLGVLIVGITHCWDQALRRAGVASVSFGVPWSISPHHRLV